MIHLTSLKDAEAKLRHLENLRDFGARQDDYIVGALGVLAADAKVHRNKMLEQVHDKLAEANILNQDVIIDGEFLHVTYVSTWHINGTTKSGCSVGIPLVLADSLSFADAAREASYTAKQRENFAARLAAKRKELTQ